MILYHLIKKNLFKFKDDVDLDACDARTMIAHVWWVVGYFRLLFVGGFRLCGVGEGEAASSHTHTRAPYIHIVH
jgi:hypothetical protein